MEYTIGFIGTGNMGAALAFGASKGCRSILLTDFDMDKAQALAERLGAAATDTVQLAQRADYIFLGVKPQVMPALLDELSPILQDRGDRFILVSMAAGLSCDTLSELIGFPAPIIRIMPNTSCAVGQGVVSYCGNSLVTADDKSELVSLMAASGLWNELDERLIDAGTAVAGCGPAFVYMFIDALADGAIACGLPPETALKYAILTVKGAACMAEASPMEPNDLKIAVCSPGGSTIRGVNSLENADFHHIVTEAVMIAFERTKELGKQEKK